MSQRLASEVRTVSVNSAPNTRSERIGNIEPILAAPRATGPASGASHTEEGPDSPACATARTRATNRSRPFLHLNSGTILAQTGFTRTSPRPSLPLLQGPWRAANPPGGPRAERASPDNTVNVAGGSTTPRTRIPSPHLGQAKPSTANTRHSNRRQLTHRDRPTGRRVNRPDSPPAGSTNDGPALGPGTRLRNRERADNTPWYSTVFEPRGGTSAARRSTSSTRLNSTPTVPSDHGRLNDTCTRPADTSRSRAFANARRDTYRHNRSRPKRSLEFTDTPPCVSPPPSTGVLPHRPGYDGGHERDRPDPRRPTNATSERFPAGRPCKLRA